MSGLRRVLRTVLMWFSALYVVAIVIAVFLAGEGIFRLKNIVNGDDCSKKGVNVAATDCVGNSNALDAHRALGTLLVFFSIVFLVLALIAWLPDKPARIVSIVVPILTFLQIVLAAIGERVPRACPLRLALPPVAAAWAGRCETRAGGVAQGAYDAGTMEGHSVISPEVLARYTLDAAAEVKGVHPKHRRGARVVGNEVEVHVVVDYGANLPAVAAQVQERVGDYLQQMADLTPAAVNVVVDDVERP